MSKIRHSEELAVGDTNGSKFKVYSFENGRIGINFQVYGGQMNAYLTPEQGRELAKIILDGVNKAEPQTGPHHTRAQPVRTDEREGM